MELQRGELRITSRTITPEQEQEVRRIVRDEMKRELARRQVKQKVTFPDPPKEAA